MSTEPRFRLSMGSSIYARFGPGNVLDVGKRYGSTSADVDMRALMAWARGASTRDPGVAGEDGR